MSQTQALQAWLDARADEMAALLMRLVAMNTENPPGRGLGECARTLHDAMERLGFATELIPIPPSGTLEEPCILRAEVGDGPRTVYFHGHFDVVPAQSPEQFEPSREHGRIIGRGTADMKGGLVSMLYGTAAARDLGLLQNGRIVFHIVCDEETGSVAGSGYQREHEMIDPSALARV
ncbi:MAG: M20/M25/M40 family metallo-hydrolase, partial [Nitrolancea sp.]